MATPNLVNIATITPKNAMGTLGDTNRTTMIDVPAETAVRIDTILLANIDGTNAANLSAVWYNADNTTQYHLAKTIQVPADSTLVVLGKDSPIYLEEGDKIQALASAASDLDIIISYEELDDA